MNMSTPTGDEPRVSVLIPVYNGQVFLKEAIDCVLAASIDSIEVLVLDDGSTDDTSKILASYDDERITVIHQSNIGLAATLNKGISLARGTYIARQDQDDLMLPGRLAKQVAFLEANPQVAMVGTWAEIRVVDKPDERAHRHPSACDVLRFRLLFDNPFVHSSIMMRADVVRGLGGYSEDKSRQPPEDYELWSRIAAEHHVANLSEILTVYREMPSSMSRSGVDPFLPNVLRISAENLQRVLSPQFSLEECLSLSCLYHNAPGAPYALSKGNALVMIQRAAEYIGGNRLQWSQALASEMVRMQHHISSRFLQRRIPPSLLGPARFLRRLINGRGN